MSFPKGLCLQMLVLPPALGKGAVSGSVFPLSAVSLNIAFVSAELMRREFRFTFLRITLRKELFNSSVSTQLSKCSFCLRLVQYVL